MSWLSYIERCGSWFSWLFFWFFFWDRISTKVVCCGALAAQFLDFWLAYFVVVVTCLYMASFKQSTKAVAHLGVAIITAAAIKEDATR